MSCQILANSRQNMGTEGGSQAVIQIVWVPNPSISEDRAKDQKKERQGTERQRGGRRRQASAAYRLMGDVEWSQSGLFTGFNVFKLP